MQLAKMGISADGAQVFVTDFPCVHCTKLLLQAGITKINYLRNYHNDDFVMNLLQVKNVSIEQVVATKADLQKIDFAAYL